MDYKKNRMIEKLKRDELVTCLKINITDNIPTEIAAMCGVDCVWLDMEHVAADYSHAGSQDARNRGDRQNPEGSLFQSDEAS